MMRAAAKATVMPAMVLLVLCLGLACVYVRHEVRKLFVELQQLEHERDRLEIEWGKLRIEQSSWSSHGRVENIARDELNMIDPGTDAIMAIRR